MQSKAREYHLSGQRLYGEKRYPEAISEFNKGLKLNDPKLKADLMDSKAAAMNRVEAWRNHAYELAQRLCKEYGDKSFRPWYRKADILYAMGLYAKALVSLKEAWKLVQPNGVAVAESVESDTPTKQQARERIKNLQARIIEDRRRGGEIALAKEREAEDRLREEIAAREKTRLAAIKAKINYVHLLSADNLISIAQHGLMEDSLFALRMSHVSKGWRDVVTHQPSLWSTLILDSKRPVVLASLWKKYSNNRIIQLEFKPGFPYDKVPTVQDKLDGCLNELKSLSISSRALPGLLFVRWPMKFKLLETLAISNQGENRWGIESDGGLLHPNCSSLRQLHLSRVSLMVFCQAHAFSDMTPTLGERCTCKIQTRLASVTDFRYDGDPFKLYQNQEYDCHEDVLRLMPKVEHCSIQTPDWNILAPVQDSPPDQKNRRFTLDNLISFEGNRISASTFRYAMIPNLTFLSLWAHNSSNIVPHVLAPGLSAALSKLRTLDIGKTTFPQDEFLTALKPMVSLQFLNVSFCDIKNEFLSALIYKPDDERFQLLPNLCALSIAGNLEISGGPLLSLYKSRSRLAGGEAKASTPRGSNSIKRAASFGRPTPPHLTKKQMTSRTSAFSSSSSANVAEVDQGQPDSRRRPLDIIASMENQQSTPYSQSAQAATTRNHGPAQLTWLCIDHCDRVEGEAVAYLRSRLHFLSWAFPSRMVEDKVRGRGRYAWDADWTSACRRQDDDGEKSCTMKRVPGSLPSDKKYYVHHKCRFSDDNNGSEDDAAWVLASKSSLDRLEQIVAREE